MTDRKTVLKFAHLGRGRLGPAEREIVEAERRSFDAHVAEIQDEQERENATLAERKARSSGRRLLVVVPRPPKWWMRRK